MILESKYSIFTLDYDLNVEYVKDALVERLYNFNHTKEAQYELTDKNGIIHNLPSFSLNYGWDMVRSDVNKANPDNTYNIRFLIKNSIPYRIYSIHREPIQLLSFLLKEIYIRKGSSVPTFYHCKDYTRNLFDYRLIDLEKLSTKIYVKDYSYISYSNFISLKFEKEIDKTPLYPSLAIFPYTHNQKLTKLVTKLYQMRLKPPRKWRR